MSAESKAAAAAPAEPADTAPASEQEERARAEAEARRARDIRDRRLVRRLKAGDERAFREMVATYQDRIFGLTYRMIGNRQEAEDLAQEVFLSVYRAIGNYRGEGRFYTWLYRIASNTCKNRIKYLKTRKFHRADDVAETPAAHMKAERGSAAPNFSSNVPGPEQIVEANRMERAVQTELANLDPEHRLLIVLRDIQGMTYQDMIKVTGLPEGTLKSRLHRARLALKKRMEPYLR